MRVEAEVRLRAILPVRVSPLELVGLEEEETEAVVMPKQILLTAEHPTQEEAEAQLGVLGEPLVSVELVVAEMEAQA